MTLSLHMNMKSTSPSELTPAKCSEDKHRIYDEIQNLLVDPSMAVFYNLRLQNVMSSLDTTTVKLAHDQSEWGPSFQAGAYIQLQP